MSRVQTTDTVISLAGHDKGKIFTVVKTEDDFAYLTDGKTRKLSDPKKKSVKHLKKLDVQSKLLADALNCGNATDSLVRKELAIISGEIGITEEGSQTCQKTM